MSKVFYFIFVSLLLLSFGASLFADNLTDMPDKYLDKSIKELNSYMDSSGVIIKKQHSLIDSIPINYLTIVISIKLLVKANLAWYN